MPHNTLAIVFRNPHPQRSPIRARLYVVRLDGSSAHIDCSDERELHRPDADARVNAISLHQS
jgi:hypothetical protein